MALLRFAFVAALLSFTLVATVSLAQDDPAVPTLSPGTPLALGQSVTGTAPASMPPVHRFDVPADQDVVVALEADGVLLYHACVSVQTAAATETTCARGSGSGSDQAIATEYYFPATDQPETRQTIDLALNRPFDDRPAHYQLTAIPVTPQSLIVGQSLEVTPTASVRYQVYTLEADPAQPFIIQIEDAASSDFLWAAYNPHLGYAVPMTAERVPFPTYVDGASAGKANSLASLTVYYLGGRTFRVLVEASVPYVLHSTPLLVPTLDPERVLTVVTSYRVPYQVIRLAANPGDRLAIDVRIVDGIGGLASVAEADRLDADSSALGPSQYTDTVFPLDATIEHKVAGQEDTYLVVQVPFDFTRDQVIYEVSWRRLARLSPYLDRG